MFDEMFLGEIRKIIREEIEASAEEVEKVKEHLNRINRLSEELNDAIQEFNDYSTNLLSVYFSPITSITADQVLISGNPVNSGSQIE